MPVDAAFVEKLAPDQASLQAAMKLLRANGLTRFATDGAGSLVWAECQGSGSLPYRLVAAVAEAAYKCTCPSRKFPCKHVLALYWRFAERPGEFAPEEPPDWVQDWLSRRRGPRAARPNGEKVSAAEALAASAESPADPEAAAKAERQRERLRAEREAAVLEGLEQLEIWLDDQIARGLAGFAAGAADQCRIAARRLADAKAPGLASWLDSLPAHYLRQPDQERAGWLVEQFGLIALAIEAYRRQDALPPPLAADIRRIAGWTIRRDDLIAAPDALRVEDRWRVIATLAELQPDGLKRTEVWLERASPAAPGFAALIDFTPANAPVGLAFSPGEAFEARLVFFPSAWPLRAVIESRGAAVGDFAPPAPPAGLEPALAAWRDALARQPWLDRVPLAVGGLALGRVAGRLALVDGRAALAFPVAAEQEEPLSVLFGADGLEACGLWNGRTFEVLRLEGPYGRWHAE